MSLSSSLQRFLADMEYPATKDDLIREATRDGLPAADVDALARLDAHSYSARWFILNALRDASRELVAA